MNIAQAFNLPLKECIHLLEGTVNRSPSQESLLNMARWFKSQNAIINADFDRQVLFSFPREDNQKAREHWSIRLTYSKDNQLTVLLSWEKPCVKENISLVSAFLHQLNADLQEGIFLFHPHSDGCAFRLSRFFGSTPLTQEESVDCLMKAVNTAAEYQPLLRELFDGKQPSMLNTSTAYRRAMLAKKKEAD